MKKKIIIIIISIILICSISVSCLFIFKPKTESVKELTIKDNIILKNNTAIVDDILLFGENVSNYTIKYYKDGEEINFEDTYDKAGTFDIEVTVDDKVFKSKLIIVDTIEPKLELQEVTINYGKEYKIEDFVKSCTDNSLKECTLKYKDDTTYTEVGSYDITIIASDESKNEIEASTKLIINEVVEEEEVKTETKTSTSKNTKSTTSGNTTTKSNTSSKSNSNSTSSSGSSTSTVKKLEKKTETSSVTEDYKYGVKKIITTTTTYDLYSDGSKKNVKTTTKESYDYSGYNATAKDLLSEAISNRSKYSTQVNDVLKYTNMYREEVGAQALVIDEDLMKVAMVRALEMGYGNKLDHLRPNGTYCFSVAKELGFGDFRGENLAWGQSNGQGATTWWRNSSGHYANMVDKGYTKIGIGVFKYNGRYLWVQVFA